MAPRLALSKIQLICDMFKSDELLKVSQIADAAECSRESVYYILSNLRQLNSARAPPIRAGRQRTITPLMLEALCDRLLEKPGLDLDEMAVFLWDQFHIHVTTCSISRALTSIGWSKKTAKQKAKERSPDLRDSYVHYLSDFHSYQLVYVDESGCDKRIGFRRTALSDTARVCPRWYYSLSCLSGLDRCCCFWRFHRTAPPVLWEMAGAKVCSYYG